MTGLPVIAGTRITVELSLDKHAAGETTEQLLESHPRLPAPGGVQLKKVAGLREPRHAAA
jgi:hypothetical protein